MSERTFGEFDDPVNKSHPNFKEGVERGDAAGPSGGDKPDIASGETLSTGGPSPADESWELPLPARRNRRRVIELTGVAVLLLLALVARPWYSRVYNAFQPRVDEQAAAEKQQKERAEKEQKDRAEAEERDRKVRRLKSAPGELMTDVAAYFTFEPDTIERLPRTTIVKDLSGHSHHGVLHNAKLVDRGKIGSGVALNGEDQYLMLPMFDRRWTNSGDPFSVSMWVYEDRYKSRAYLLHTGNPDLVVPGFVLMRRPSERNFEFVPPMSASRARSSECAVLQWHHIVAVSSERELTLCVDGQVHSVPGSATYKETKDTNEYLGMGTRLGDGVSGVIDEIALFRRRLSPEEMTALYEMGLEGKRLPPSDPSPSLKAFYADYAAKQAFKAKTFNEDITKHAKEWEKYEETPAANPRGGLHQVSHTGLHQESQAFRFTPDGKIFISGQCCGCVLQQWVGTDSNRKMGRGMPNDCCLIGLAMAPDGSRVACYGESRRICMWDVKKAAVTSHIETPFPFIHSAVFTADGKSILVAAQFSAADAAMHAVTLWDANENKEIRRFPVPGKLALAVALSPDGSRAAAFSVADMKLHVIDPKKDGLVRSFSGGPDRIICIVFLPDGKRLLTGGLDGVMRLWDLQAGKQIREYHGHLAPILCVDLSRDGQFAVAGAYDGAVRAWDLERGNKLEDFTIRGKPTVFSSADGPVTSPGPVRYVAFSDDGRSFQAGFQVGIIFRFNLPHVLDFPSTSQPAK